LDLNTGCIKTFPADGLFTSILTNDGRNMAFIMTIATL